MKMPFDNIEIKRSSRRTLSVEVRRDGSLLVRAPTRMPKKEIIAFLESKREWIEQKRGAVSKLDGIQPLSGDELSDLQKAANGYISQRVAFFADKVGVEYGRITVRRQKTRWGSCSAAHNLNFNCLVMLMPREVVDYVIIHELCHIIELNHSAAFWREVARVMPDYAQHRRWLHENGDRYMKLLGE